MDIKILENLIDKYNAEMRAACLNIDVYGKSAVGIGEHPDIVEAVESQVKRYSEAKEMRDAAYDLLVSRTQ